MEHESNDPGDQVSYYRAIVEGEAEDELEQQTNLLLLAEALFNRFVDAGNMEDLTECIEISELVLASIPEDNDFTRPIVLSSLAVATDACFRRTGDLSYLDQSLSYLRQSLNSLRPEETHRHMIMDNLGVALHARFLHTGQLHDIEESISYHREALALPSDDGSENMLSLDHLCTALHARFEETGQMEDLEECIAGCRKALTSYPPEHPGKSMATIHLASALQARYERTRQLADLEQCIALNKEVLSAQKLSHFDRSRPTHNLARALRAHSSLSNGISEDLDMSINLFNEALLGRPVGHAGRPYTLDSLALALLDRFHREGKTADLDDCIATELEALTLRLEGNPKRYSSLTNLAMALRARFELSSNLEDIDSCISYGRESISLCPPGHPDRCTQLRNLGAALLSRHGIRGEEKDIEEALRVAREAATDPLDVAQPHKKVTSALLWADVARLRNDIPEALNAYSTCLQLLQQSLIITPTLETQHESMWGVGVIPRAAASFAISAGHLKMAVEMLEQGRALLWSEVRQFRTPLDALEGVDKGLRDSFVTTSRALEALSMRSVPAAMGTTQLTLGQDYFGDMLARKRELTGRLNDILERIRLLPRFADFLRTKSFDTLRTAAAEGPVIIVNHNEYRSDAVIILADRDPVSVSLPDSFYIQASELSKELLEARAHLATNPKHYDRVLRRTLRETWDILVGDVVNKLTELQVPKGTRIWWCPTSVISALPLHAAGPAPAEAGSKKKTYLSDIYVSSYTPTLTALIDARSKISGSNLGNAPKLLVIAQSDGSLQKVGEELTTLKGVANDVLLLLNEKATREAIVANMQRRAWIHFACHGTLKPDEPFNSAFIVASGERLTLLDIIKSNLPTAELAFLSACHTAEEPTGGASEEVLHLAAAMQFSGFRSVVGTMWQMVDADGPVLTKDFYKEMVLDVDPQYPSEVGFKRAARSLCSAAKKLRKKRVDLERWVNFVHIGA